MLPRRAHGYIAWPLLLVALSAFACGKSNPSDPVPESSGGAASGGASVQSSGGMVGDHSGGRPSGGTDGEGETGGKSSGGAAPSGGTAGGSGGEGADTGGDSGSGGQLSQGSGGAVNTKTTYVYVGSGSFGDEPGLISVYTLDRDAKELTFVSEHPAGGLASYLAIDSERGRLFAADEKDGGVRSYSIDPATGMLASLGATSSSNQPVYVALSPDGSYLLAANYNQGSVDVYPIESDGSAGMSSGETATGAQAHCVVIDQGGRVYVANKGSSTLSHFQFSGGELSAPQAGSTSFVSPRHIFLVDDKAYVISEEQDNLAAFSIGSDGALSLDWERPRLENSSGTGADVRVTPSGRFLYATNRDPENSIVAYELSASEPLYLGHTSTRGATPRNFAIDPLEELVIVANHGESKSLAVFSIQGDGTLQHENTLTTSYSPFFVGIAQLSAP